MAARKNGAELRNFSPSRMESYREKKGLTRRALSTLVNVTEQTLYSWGTGRTIPNADQAEALRLALGINLDDLFE